MIHALRRGTNRAALAATAAFVMVVTATPAHAGGSSMPWEAPLQRSNREAAEWSQ